MPMQRGQWKWIRHPRELANDMEVWAEVQIRSRAVRRAERLADEITAWMKDNAVWEDRTGDARRSLQCRMERNGQSKNLRLIMEYADDNVYYDIYLETMQTGRFSILMPTLNTWAPRFTERILGD